MAKKLTTNSIIAVTEPEELSGMVTVIAAKTAQYMTPGNEYTVSAELARTLIKKGKAILKK